MWKRKRDCEAKKKTRSRKNNRGCFSHYRCLLCPVWVCKCVCGTTVSSSPLSLSLHKCLLTVYEKLTQPCRAISNTPEKVQKWSTGSKSDSVWQKVQRKKNLFTHFITPVIIFAEEVMVSLTISKPSIKRGKLKLKANTYWVIKAWKYLRINNCNDCNSYLGCSSPVLG